MTQRPWLNASIAVLREIYTESTHDARMLRALNHELSYRKSRAAKALRKIYRRPFDQLPMSVKRGAQL